MRARDYELIAGIVNRLPTDIQPAVADHFAREFHAAHPAFDLGAWESRTKGTLKRIKIETEDEKRRRVLAYADEVLSRKST